MFINNIGVVFDYVEDCIFDGGGSFELELIVYYFEDNW